VLAARLEDRVEQLDPPALLAEELVVAHANLGRILLGDVRRAEEHIPK